MIATRRNLTTSLVLVLALSLMLLLAVPAKSSGPRFGYLVTTYPELTYITLNSGNTGCTISAGVYLWENGKTGITRLGMKYDMRRPGIPGSWWAKLSGTSYDSGWNESPTFPNDSTSYSHSLTLAPGEFKMWPSVTELNLWVHFRGHRTMWRDAKASVNLGSFGCDVNFSSGV